MMMLRVLLTTAAVLLADGFSTSGDRRASTTPRSRESPGRGRKSQPLGLRPPWATADAAAAGVTATAEKPVLTITSLQHLGEEELRSRDASAPLLIVKYYAKSCRACAAIAPKYRSLARDLGASASCFEMESKQFKGMADRLGITRLPCIHVYAGGVMVEDLVCGPSKFPGVRSAIENDVFCDPRQTAPCEIVYDDALGPRPDFAVVPQGYTTGFAQRMAELEAAATEPAPTVVFRRLSADSPAATAAEPTAAETAAEPTSTRPASANIIRFAGTPAADSEEAV